LTGIKSRRDLGQSQAIALPLINAPPMPHRPAQVFDPAPDQMKTTAEAADVISLGASFPSLAMGMGDGRARCFRQGLPCPANPKTPAHAGLYLFFALVSFPALPFEALYHPVTLRTRPIPIPTPQHGSGNGDGATTCLSRPTLSE
jgi:hypothetical protein